MGSNVHPAGLGSSRAGWEGTENSAMQRDCIPIGLKCASSRAGLQQGWVRRYREFHDEAGLHTNWAHADRAQTEPEPRAAGVHRQIGQGPAGTGAKGRRSGSKSWARTNENQSQATLVCVNDTYLSRTSRHWSRGPKKKSNKAIAKTDQLAMKQTPPVMRARLLARGKQRVG